MNAGSDAGTNTVGSGGSTTAAYGEPAVERYLGGLRAALADLPPGELAEIVDDAREHLREVAAELGPGPDGAQPADLEARLGTPAAYAADLRAAAGYAPAPAVAPPPRRIRGGMALGLLVLATVVVLLAAVAVPEAAVLVGLPVALVGFLFVVRRGPRVPDVAALAPVRALRAAVPRPDAPGGRIVGFLASLQPAWWVLRGLVGAQLLVSVFGGGGGVAPVLLLALVAVPVSVWLGHLSRRDRRWLWAVVPLNALAAVLATSALTALPRSDADPSPADVDAQTYPTGLVQDGIPVRDLRPFDANGAPLTGVHLFDQDGRRIVTLDDCDDGVPPTTPPAVAYPRGTRVYDDATGRCVVQPPVPLVVTVPTSGAPSSTAPSGGPTAAPSDGPGPGTAATPAPSAGPTAGPPPTTVPPTAPTTTAPPATAPPVTAPPPG